jgi:hypothetical protein
MQNLHVLKVVAKFRFFVRFMEAPQDFLHESVFMKVLRRSPSEIPPETIPLGESR